MWIHAYYYYLNPPGPQSNCQALTGPQLEKGWGPLVSGIRKQVGSVTINEEIMYFIIVKESLVIFWTCERFEQH